MTEPLTIVQRIQLAQRDIAKHKFEKTCKVKVSEEKSYFIIPIADILEVVRKVQQEHGITLLLGQIQFDKDNFEANMNGHAKGHVDYKLVGSSMDDCIEGTVSVEARDTYDKMVNKLYTNAMRTIYRTIYTVDSGEDPEMENEGDKTCRKPPVAQPNQSQTVRPPTGTKPPVTDITTDRDPEVMIQTIEKQRGTFIGSDVFFRYSQSLGNNVKEWPLESIKSCYAEIVKARRSRE